MELENQLPELIKQKPNILPMIYSDLAQPSIRKVGKALETVFEFSTSFLLPLKLLNEKFKINFERNLNDYKKKIENILEDKICDVDPQIGTPIIETLTYTTNEEIADLFTTLLAKATSIETVNQAHPSFVQFVERLSVDEARVIKRLKRLLIAGIDFVPCLNFKGIINEEKSFLFIGSKETTLPDQVIFIFPDNVVAYIDNLISMGVFDISHGKHLTEIGIYDSILLKWDFESKKKQCMEQRSRFIDIEYEKSYLQITDFGKLFINACTMDETITTT